MSSSISIEAVAEFIHVNCTREYRIEVVDKLETALLQRNCTIQTIYDEIEALNRLQSMVNKFQLITIILDAVLTIGNIASMFGAIPSIAFNAIPPITTGAHYFLKNIACNSKVKPVREAMMEDKKHRDNLQALLRQQDLTLPFEVIEFKSKTGIIHKVFSAISMYITGDSVDWVKHLENFGVVEIIPVAPPLTEQNATTQPKSFLSNAFKMIKKAVNFLQGLMGEKCKKIFAVINAIISLFCKCLNCEGNLTADLLEAIYIPELMKDTVVMQELLEKLIGNYRL